jgi:hypothetical protein
VTSEEQVRKARDSALKSLRQVGIAGFPKEVFIRLVDRYELNRLSNGLSLHANSEMRGLTRSIETLQGGKRVASKHTVHLLEHLPALELEGILAHELMHVWLFERKAKLSHRQIEGFCNLGNYLIFSRRPSPMASYLLRNLKEDNDPIYGAGYRDMRRQLDELGWKRLLANLAPEQESAVKPARKFRLPFGRPKP